MVNCKYVHNNKSYYRPQAKFAKVMFLQVSVCPHGGHAWLLWGVHVFSGGGMCGFFLGGHAWFSRGGMHGCSCGGGMCGFSGGGGMCGFFWGGMHRIRRDTVNERAVCILLECILVVLSINRETLRGAI